MKIDRSIGNADRIVVAAMVVALAACGIAGIWVRNAPSDVSNSAASSASGVVTVAADGTKLIARTSESDDWFADDSAQGTRPDASH